MRTPFIICTQMASRTTITPQVTPIRYGPYSPPSAARDPTHSPRPNSKWRKPSRVHPTLRAVTIHGDPRSSSPSTAQP